MQIDLGDDNFEEDITISPCVDCKWKGTNKCRRCTNRNRISPMRIWQPPISPTVKPPFYPPTINRWRDNTYPCFGSSKPTNEQWDGFINNVLSNVR